MLTYWTPSDIQRNSNQNMKDLRQDNTFICKSTVFIMAVILNLRLQCVNAACWIHNLSQHCLVSGNSLLPDDTKLLPEPMLTLSSTSSRYIPLNFSQFQKQHISHQSLKLSRKLIFYAVIQNFPGPISLVAFTYHAGHIGIQGCVVFRVRVFQVQEVVDVGPHAVFLRGVVEKTLKS